MIHIEQQEKLVQWGYLVQWCALAFPPLVVASLLYLLVIRKYIANRDIYSHVSWQLGTAGVAVLALPVAFLLLMIGLSGWNSDSLLAIVSTLFLTAAGFVFLPWLIYRLIRGTANFANEQPMSRLFP